VLVLDDHLAIDQGRFAGQLAGSLDHPAIGSGPVPAMTREGSDLAAVDDDQGAVAVILDLVNPASSPRWRLRDRGRDFELDEAERGY
jgi:hypothetical protein